MRHRTIRSIIAMLIAAATITAILIVTLLIFNWFTADHPKRSYRSLDYEVAVHPNSDLKVTQHIDMKLDSRGQEQAVEAAVLDLRNQRIQSFGHHRHLRHQYDHWRNVHAA